MSLKMKEVYLKLGSERNKCVKFQSGAGTSDVDSLRLALGKAKETDADLCRRMDGCTVVFQKLKIKKSTQEKVLVDIDDLEDIEDESDLVPIFCPILNSPNMDGPLVIGTGETTLQVQPDGSCVIENGPCGTPSSPQDHSSADCLGLDSSCSPSVNSIVRPKRGRKDQNCALMTLPALPSNLKAMIGKANSCMEKFIAHYGHYLRTVTEDLISKADYKIFSLTIIKAHPELSDPTNVENPNHLVKDMLSMFVRNARRKDKFVPLSLTDDHEEPARKKQRKFIMPSESVTSRTEAEASEMNKLQEALKGIGPNVGATTHHTRLIRETFVPRREWISHLPPDSSPTLIIHEYPHLQKVDLICYEFSLMRKKDVLSLQSDLGDAVQSIANFISLPSRTERERADFLCKLYNDVKPKNVSKKLPPCFSIQQCQGDPDVHLKSEAGEGARLVFFFDTEDKLGAAFIVGDTLAMPVNNPTVCGSLLALLACYHAWDLTYPPAFKCVLLIFDVHGLGTITNDLNGAFKKFNIDYSRFKLSQTF